MLLATNLPPDVHAPLPRFSEEKMRQLYDLYRRQDAELLQYWDSDPQYAAQAAYHRKEFPVGDFEDFCDTFNAWPRSRQDELIWQWGKSIEELRQLMLDRVHELLEQAGLAQ